MTVASLLHAFEFCIPCPVILIYPVLSKRVIIFQLMEFHVINFGLFMYSYSFEHEEFFIGNGCAPFSFLNVSFHEHNFILYIVNTQ